MFAKFLSETNKSLIVRLFRENFKAHVTWYGIAIICMLVVAGTTAASAWIMRDVVNETVVNKDIDKIFMVALTIAFIFATKGIATYVQTVFLSRAGNSIIAHTQRKLYKRILSQGLTFFSAYSSSDLMVRVTTNAQAARQVIDVIVTSFVRDLFSLLGLIAVMVIQQPVLSLVSLIIGPAAIIGVRLLTKKVRAIMEQELASLAMIVQNMQETTTGIRVIKAFALEDYMNRRMDKYVAEVEARANSISRIEAATSPIMESLSGFAIAGIVALGGIWVVQEGNTPGELMSFITALLLAYEPAKRLARMRVSLESGLVGVRLMYELADEPVTLIEKDNAIDLPAGDGEIRFNNIHFAYQEGEPVFNGLNLAFAAGKTTALVGPSGGGKSSIINMIMRLYDPDQGSVTIDGHDIKDINFHSLRSRIAYVGQDTFLFAGSIKHNIGLGREGASDDEIIAAAKAANAHDFIMRMKNGYDNDVGENGGNLSGGQKQRLAIARAMLRNAEILILDEATSALDSESEAQVSEALKRLTANRTTIMIAHRLSTITSADNIVVMQSGEVAEQGPQAKLLAQDGAYRKLYEFQLLPAAGQLE